MHLGVSSVTALKIFLQDDVSPAPSCFPHVQISLALCCLQLKDREAVVIHKTKQVAL